MHDAFLAPSTLDLPPALPPVRVREPFPATPSDEVSRVPEALIHDLWTRGLFRPESLTTTAGETVRILDRGRLNHDSGPDIADARIQIGDVVWAGDVEIHRASAEWEAHGHQTDPAYDRVILHVILAPDARTGTLRRSDGSVLPEVALLDALDRPLRRLLRDVHLCPSGVPHCRARWQALPDGLARGWIRTLGSERIATKADALAAKFATLPDVDALLTRRVFRALGYAANSDAMEALAARVPLDLVRTLDADDVHALLLGLAGWLDDAGLFDAQESDLAGRFEVLRVARRLAPMNRAAWRRGGRPANAPTRRIAQAAALLAPGGLLRDDPVEALRLALTRSTADALDLLRPTPRGGSPRLGRGRAEAVLTNAVLPVLALHAEIEEHAPLNTLIVDTLDALAAEHDRVTRPFEHLGLRPTSALESQGLQRLARAYCEAGRCAACPIGHALYPSLAKV